MPAPRLSDLFTSVASATVAAQLRMDERLPHRPPLVYSLPRVEVKARFGAAQVQGKTFFFFGKASRQDLLNTLRFRLVAVHAAGAQTLPPQTGPSPDRVLAPPFLVPLVERETLVADLLADLRAMDKNRYANEVRAIQNAFEKGSDDPGITFLRLNAGVILIARIGGDNDGIFLRDGSATPRHTVVSYLGASGNPLPWAPFHRLFDVLRDWQANDYPLSPIGGLTPPGRFGSIEIAGFSADLVQAAAAARDTISQTPPGPVFPVLYSLQDISADLSYLVPRQTGATPPAESPLIRSVARVSPKDDGSAEVSLLSPEFVLTGPQRSAFFALFDSFLQLGSNDDQGLWSHVAAQFRNDYQHALSDVQRRRNSLVFLSYRGKIPVNQFLVVWPAGGDQDREFAFRVKLDGNRLVYESMVRRLEDSDGQVEYDSRHPGLHDFFHACWIWDLAGDWYDRS